MIENKQLPLTPEAQDQPEKFITDFHISSPKKDSISCNLSGHSYADFLVTAQELGVKVFGRNLISPDMLEGLQYRPEFNDKVALDSTPLVLDATPIIPEDQFYTRVDIDRALVCLGKEMPSVADLAVGHVAYMLTRGKDLFDGTLGLAKDGSLFLSEKGLDVWAYGTVIGRLGTVTVLESSHKFVPPAGLLE
jgi:hypothetical protein